MIYIWIRSTTDWADEAAFRAQLDPQFAPKVDVWDRTFDMPFHRFRHEVREIAAKNLARVRDAVVAAWDDIPDGALVLPVDDDDWFAPDIADHLAAAAAPGVEGYFWIQTAIEVPVNFGHRLALMRRALAPSTPPRWICGTNNYALLKRADTRESLAWHVPASDWFAQAESARVRWIERRLSVSNRTLASRTSMGFRRSQISARALRRKFRSYRELYRSYPVAPDLAWCRPSIDEMAALMGRLTLRSTR